LLEWSRNKRTASFSQPSKEAQRGETSVSKKRRKSIAPAGRNLGKTEKEEKSNKEPQRGDTSVNPLRNETSANEN